jgi:predicted DNA-binding transcriptional regulator AlpA
MSFCGGMPKPLPRVPHVESPFLLRAELLSLVPFSMASVDRLEGKGQFPKRIRLEPTNRVAWLRREVTGYLRQLAKRRQPAAQEHQVKATVTGSKRTAPISEQEPANPPLKLFAETPTNAAFKAPGQREVPSAMHIGFDPIPDQLFCRCGYGIEPSSFNLQRHSENSALISCRACNAELAQINFNIER